MLHTIKYSYIYTKLRALYSKYLSETILSSLIKEQKIENLEKYFFVKPKINDIDKEENFYSCIYTQYSYIINYLSRFLSNSECDYIDFFEKRIIIENVLFIIKSILRDDSAEYVKERLIKYKENIFHIDEYWSRDRYAEIFKDTIFYNIIKDLNIFSMKESIYKIDVKLENFYYKSILEKADELNPRDSMAIKSLINFETLIKNILVVMRLKFFYKRNINFIMQQLILPGSKIKLFRELAEVVDIEDINNHLPQKIRLNEKEKYHFISDYEDELNNKYLEKLKQFFYSEQFHLSSIIAFLLLFENYSKYLKSAFESIRIEREKQV